MNKIRCKIAAATLAVASAFVSQAYAAGFQLTEQSAAGLGRAFAGAGVDGTDISGVYYNPATMTLHPGFKMQMGTIGIDMDLEVEGKGPMTGVHENGRYKPNALPHGFISWQLTDSVWAGLAMTVPFGLGTSYNDDWVLNRYGQHSTVLTFDFNPNIAWKASEKLSFGAGLSIQYARAALKKNGAPASVDGQPTMSLQAHSQVKADSIDFGWNIGVMWTPVENVRIGLSYRSEVTHEAEGDLHVSEVSPEITALTGLRNGTYDGEADVTAPAWALLSAAWDINEQWSLYGSIRWTDWSSFDVLPIRGLVNGMTVVSSEVENRWQDTWYYSVGADYRVTPQWTVRAGIGYDTCAIEDKTKRNAVVPDADRWWFSLGTSYQIDKNMIVDFALAHLRVTGERSMYLPNTNTEVARFKTLSAWLLGAQVQFLF